MKLQYIFHTDPGHGWLEVSMATLKSLGIDEEITPYSYIGRGGVAYLEEDCDAGTFIQAYREATGSTPEFVERHSNASSFIRGLWPYFHPTHNDMPPLVSTKEDQ